MDHDVCFGIVPQALQRKRGLDDVARQAFHERCLPGLDTWAAVHAKARMLPQPFAHRRKRGLDDNRIRFIPIPFFQRIEAALGLIWFRACIESLAGSAL
mgnify:CR=1 FL=1